MDREIPIYFDSVIVDSSPIQETSTDNQNLYRLKVRVFTKYANRNGSYITDEVANQLIASATQGMTPVVGFFDPETQTWASHTGPTLANAYGYVEDFLGWEPFADSDGITREYAVFSVNLFTEYFEEAKKIIGQNQSMELNPLSITGDWAEINSEYYYVYKTAKMLGFCVIGAHEPCFSASAFFSNNEEQLQQISSLLFGLRSKIEEIEKNNQGGEQPMDEFEKEVVDQPEVQPEAAPEVEAETEFEQVEEAPVVEEEVQLEVEAEPSEFEVLQNKFNELEEKYNELNSNYQNAMETIAQLEADSAAKAQEFEDKYAAASNDLQAKENELKALAEQYDLIIATKENERKNSLIEKYEKVLKEEEISEIKKSFNDFSYDELESKLAIIFANKQMLSSEEHKVPLPEPQESQFALLMKKYRK